MSWFFLLHFLILFLCMFFSYLIVWIIFIFSCSTGSFLIKKFINNWNKVTLISIIFQNFSNIKWFIKQSLSEAVLLKSITHVIMKTSLIYFVLINISWISCFFKTLYSFFVFLKDPQALYLNPSCLKCISVINLYPANKKLLTVLFILHLV